MARKAVLIGISYADNRQIPTLDGPVHDVLQAKSVLTLSYGFAESDLFVLVDDPCVYKGGALSPTKSNLLAALDWLVKGARDGDILYVHFSGYGSQVPSKASFEGLEEVILPIDATCDASGFRNFITHDVFLEKFDCVPKGVTVVFVFDTGFRADNECAAAVHHYTCRSLLNKAVRTRGLENVGVRAGYRKLNEDGRFAALKSGNPLRDRCFATPCAWFASDERQPSWDAKIEGKAVGAFSYYFYGAISNSSNGTDITNDSLLSATTQALYDAGFLQKPVFASVDADGKQKKFLPPVPAPPAPVVCPAPSEPHPVCGPPRTVDSIVRDLVCALGVTGLDIATRIREGWSKLTVEEQVVIYESLFTAGGVNAVKLGAELAGDERFLQAIKCLGDVVFEKCSRYSLSYWVKCSRPSANFCFIPPPSPAIPVCPPPFACPPACPPHPFCPPACPPPPCLTRLQELSIAYLKKHVVSADCEHIVEILATRIALSQCAALTDQQRLVDQLSYLVQPKAYASIAELFCDARPPAGLKLPCAVCADPCTPPPAPLPTQACVPPPPAPPAFVELDARQSYFVSRIVSYVKCSTDAPRVKDMATKLAGCAGIGLTAQQAIIDEIATLVEADGWFALKLIFAKEVPAGLKFPEKCVAPAAAPSVCLRQACLTAVQIATMEKISDLVENICDRELVRGMLLKLVEPCPSDLDHKQSLVDEVVRLVKIAARPCLPALFVPEPPKGLVFPAGTFQKDPCEPKVGGGVSLTVRQKNAVDLLARYALGVGEVEKVRDLATVIACNSDLTRDVQQQIIDKIATLVEIRAYPALPELLSVDVAISALVFPPGTFVSTYELATGEALKDLKSAEESLRDLVCMLGVEGYEIGMKVKSQWATLEVEERKSIYKSLYTKGGLDAVKAAAVLGSEVNYVELLAAAAGSSVCCPAVPPVPEAELPTAVRKLLDILVLRAGIAGYDLGVKILKEWKFLSAEERKSVYTDLLRLGGVEVLAAGAKLARDRVFLEELVAVGTSLSSKASVVCDTSAEKASQQQRDLRQVVVLAGAAGYELSVRLLSESLSVSDKRDIYSKLFAEAGLEAVRLGVSLARDTAFVEELTVIVQDLTVFLCKGGYLDECPAPALCAPKPEQPAPPACHPCVTECVTIATEVGKAALRDIVCIAGLRGYEISVRLAKESATLSATTKLELYGELLRQGGLDALRLAAVVEGNRCFLDELKKFGEEDVLSQVLSAGSDSACDRLRELIGLASVEGYLLGVTLVEKMSMLSLKERWEIYGNIYAFGGLGALKVAIIASKDKEVAESLKEFADKVKVSIVELVLETVCVSSAPQHKPEPPACAAAYACCAPPAVVASPACLSIPQREALNSEQKRIILGLYYLAGEDERVKIYATQLAEEGKGLSEESKRKIIGHIICRTGLDGVDLVQALIEGKCVAFR